MIEKKSYLLLAAALILIGVGAVTGTFSGLDFGDTSCEWEVIESPEGETFSSFEELEQEMGSQAFNSKISEVEENPNMDVRDPIAGSVEYQVCTYED